MPEVEATYRPLCTIAREIKDDWERVNFGAKPYLAALLEMNSIGDMYGQEYGDMIVLYFLNNAGTWRGETAKRIKAELKEQVKAYNTGKIKRGGHTPNPSH